MCFSRQPKTSRGCATLCSRIASIIDTWSASALLHSLASASARRHHATSRFRGVHVSEKQKTWAVLAQSTHGLSGCDLRTSCSAFRMSSALVTLLVLRVRKRVSPFSYCAGIVTVLRVTECWNTRVACDAQRAVCATGYTLSAETPVSATGRAPPARKRNQFRNALLARRRQWESCRRRRRRRRLILITRVLTRCAKDVHAERSGFLVRVVLSTT